MSGRQATASVFKDYKFLFLVACHIFGVGVLVGKFASIEDKLADAIQRNEARIAKVESITENHGERITIIETRMSSTGAWAYELQNPSR